VNLTGSIDKNRTETVLLANTADAPTFERLLKKFPTTEMESRAISANDWKDTLFTLRKESDEELITFPKNVESFADNLFLLSILKLAILKRWKIQLSSKELDTKVLESGEGAFFAGFIAGACMRETGERVNGNTRFSKGVSAFQSFSVEKKYGKVPYLRTGGMDDLLKRLSVMKGFTKEYWGLRGTLAALFKMVKPIEVTNLKTYFMPKQEVMKHIRTKLVYENGGLFRTEEIAALSGRYSAVKELVTEFEMKLDNPTEEFIINFQKNYAPIKTAIEMVDREIKLLAVARSRILFPTGNKKGIKKFKALSLEDKLETVAEDKPTLFEPDSLPGISKDGTSSAKEGTPKWRAEVYKTAYLIPPAREVIDSWYTKFASSEED